MKERSRSSFGRLFGLSQGNIRPALTSQESGAHRREWHERCRMTHGKSCASCTAECRLILVGVFVGMTRAPFLRPGWRRRRIGGGVSFTVCTQKKGFRGNNRTYTHEGNKPGNGLISAHGGILDPIPPLAQPDQRGAENWRVKDRRKAVFRCPVAKRNTNRRITSQIQGKIPPKFGLSPRKHTLTHLGGFQWQITAQKWLSLFRQRFGEVASVVPAVQRRSPQRPRGVVPVGERHRGGSRIFREGLRPVGGHQRQSPECRTQDAQGTWQRGGAMKVAGFCRPFGVEVADFCTLFTGFCHFGVRIMPVSRSAGAVPSTPSSLFAVQNCTKCPHSDPI